MKIFRLTFVAVLLACTALAQTPSSTTLASNPVFQNNCARCHGKEANGRFMAGPSLTNEKAASQSSDQLRTMITNGKGRMPKFEGKLTAEQINTLVDEIKASPKK